MYDIFYYNSIVSKSNFLLWNSIVMCFALYVNSFIQLNSCSLILITMVLYLMMVK
jgi:hypothetical protein